jgi:hypothetical protein
MTTDTRFHTPRASAGSWISLRQQTSLLWASDRWVYFGLGLAAVLALVGGTGLGDELLRTSTMAFLPLPAAGIWSMLVWWREGPDRRSYHWSLPISRPIHDLMRVLAGAVILLGCYAVLAFAGWLAAHAQGNFDHLAALWPQSWASYFVGPTIVYLLVSPLVLWSDYAITRWAYGVILAVPGLAVILGFQGIDFLQRGVHAVLLTPEWGLGAALGSGFVDGGVPVAAHVVWPATVLWLTLGLALTAFFAIYRPADLTRLVRLRGTLVR